MRGRPEPPRGFVSVPAGTGVVYASRDLDPAVRALGLDSWEGWQRALAAGTQASGRGATAVIVDPSGRRWRVKALRRGGFVSRLTADRYLSVRRPVAMLHASVTALERGVPTARPLALIVVPAGAGVRAAAAFEELDGAEDLAHRLTRRALTREDIDAALAVVRLMHDRGIVHVDLNLGNLLVRQDGAGPAEAFVIDFDRARIVESEAPFGCRQSALRRLARSCAKLTGTPAPLGPGTEDVWYRSYAAGDGALAARFASGQPLGRALLALHRLGWRDRKP